MGEYIEIVTAAMVSGETGASTISECRTKAPPIRSHPIPFKILVVDDDIDDKHDEISKLPGMLWAAGYEVEKTPDGVRAYDLVLELQA